MSPETPGIGVFSGPDRAIPGFFGTLTTQTCSSDPLSGENGVA